MANTFVSMCDTLAVYANKFLCRLYLHLDHFFSFDTVHSYVLLCLIYTRVKIIHE